MPIEKLEQVPKFLAEIQRKLEQSSYKYGDRASRSSLSRLVAEVEEELVDIPAWTYWLWERMQGLKRKIAELEREMARGSGG